MSKTARRRDTHNAHTQGRHRQNGDVRRRPPPIRATPKARTGTELQAMVTDHAIVCWLERVHGLDVKGEFVRQLLSQERAELAATMKTGRLRINDTTTVLYIREGAVVSVAVNGQDG